ncbi:MAG: VOC family protein [Bacillota bacterium]|nr:VOC family protein [Bacillota bacterium]
MKIGFTQVSVINLEESINFYKDVLFLKEYVSFSPRQGINIVILCDEENNKIELIEDRNISEDKRNTTSDAKVAIGFLVEDIESVIEELRKKRIEIIRGPISIKNGLRFLFVKDPNGVEIEIVQGFETL